MIDHTCCLFSISVYSYNWHTLAFCCALLLLHQCFRWICIIYSPVYSVCNDNETKSKTSIRYASFVIVSYPILYCLVVSYLLTVASCEHHKASHQHEPQCLLRLARKKMSKFRITGTFVKAVHLLAVNSPHKWSLMRNALWCYVVIIHYQSITVTS